MEPYTYEAANRPLLARGEVRGLLYGIGFAAGGAIAIAAMHQAGATAVALAWLGCMALTALVDRVWP